MGVFISTADSDLGFYNLDRTTAGSYTLTWTFTASASCVGVCSAASQTTTLIWKDPCERTVITAPSVGDAQTSALAAGDTVWSFSHATDSVSLSVPADLGYTYCGDRTYTLSGHGSWLQLASSANSN